MFWVDHCSPDKALVSVRNKCTSLVEIGLALFTEYTTLHLYDF